MLCAAFTGSDSDFAPKKKDPPPSDRDAAAEIKEVRFAALDLWSDLVFQVPGLFGL